MQRTLAIVFAVGLFGVAFSATLTFQELFTPSATMCPALGAPGTVLGYPACVYGFFMYLLIAVVAGVSLAYARSRG